jgi:hypothetical protein
LGVHNTFVVTAGEASNAAVSFFCGGDEEVGEAIIYMRKGRIVVNVSVAEIGLLEGESDVLAKILMAVFFRALRVFYSGFVENGVVGGEGGGA